MHTLLRLTLICAVSLCLIGFPTLFAARADGPFVEEFDNVVDHELIILEGKNKC